MKSNPAKLANPSTKLFKRNLLAPSLLASTLLTSLSLFSASPAVADDVNDDECVVFKMDGVLMNSCTGKPIYPEGQCAWIKITNKGNEQISANATKSQCNDGKSHASISHQAYDTIDATGSVYATLGGSITLNFTGGGESGSSDSITFNNIGPFQSIECEEKYNFLSTYTGCSISGDAYDAEAVAAGAAAVIAAEEAKQKNLASLKLYIDMGENENTDFFSYYEWSDAQFRDGTPYSDIIELYFAEKLSAGAVMRFETAFNNADDEMYTRSSGDTCTSLEELANADDNLSIGFCKSEGKHVVYRQYETLPTGRTLSSVNIICETASINGCYVKLDDYGDEDLTQVLTCESRDTDCSQHSYYGPADVINVWLTDRDDWFDATAMDVNCTPIRINLGKASTSNIDMPIKTGCGDDSVISDHRIGTTSQSLIGLGSGSNIALSAGWISQALGGLGNTVRYRAFEDDDNSEIGTELAAMMMAQLKSLIAKGYTEDQAMHATFWYDLVDQADKTDNLIHLYLDAKAAAAAAEDDDDSGDHPIR